MWYVHGTSKTEREGLELFMNSCTLSITLEPTQYHSCIDVQQMRGSSQEV